MITWTISLNYSYIIIWKKKKTSKNILTTLNDTSSNEGQTYELNDNQISTTHNNDGDTEVSLHHNTDKLEPRTT